MSFADGKFLAAQDRLVNSVRKFGYTIFTYNDFDEIGSPKHTDSPYEFKMHAVRTVYMKGYDLVIWCDSIMWLIRPITAWIPEIEKRGVYLQSDIHRIGTWANDKSLDAFNITRDDAMEMNAISAGVIGFDFTHPKTKQFLYRWKECADKGLFKGERWNTEQTESKDPRCEGHRNDQTCAELVAREIGLDIGYRVSFYDEELPKPTVFFLMRK